MKDKVFGVLQRIGRSFMLPIALLPVAGLFLGIGSSFTNETMLNAYNLTWLIYPGSIIYTVLDILSKAGSAVFDNLADGCVWRYYCRSWCGGTSQQIL